jgi:predicted XRE-type DNA-binding protein
LNKLFVYPELYIINWISLLNEIQLLLFSELSVIQQIIPIAIPSWIPEKKSSILYGLRIATQLRLQNYSNPIILLTFHKSDSIHKQDEIGISKINGTSVVQLPCTQETIQKAIATTVQIEDSELQLFREKIFKQNYDAIIRQLRHGGQHDFVNNVTGPLRAACVMAKYKPESAYNINQQIQRINKYLSSSGILDFLQTISCFSNANIELKGAFQIQPMQFFEELKLFMNNLNSDQINLDGCINTIDNLNQKLLFLKET